MSLCRSATRLMTGMALSGRHGPLHHSSKSRVLRFKKTAGPIDQIEKRPYTGPRACSFRRFDPDLFRQKSCSCAGRTLVVEIFGVWAGSSVVEHLTFNQVVDGSIPSRLTKLNQMLRVDFGSAKTPKNALGFRLGWHFLQ